MEATPYARAAKSYFEAGWSPLPLPHEAKSPVPDGFTGAPGKYVDTSQLRRWTAERARATAGKLNYPPSNIAIRLPRDIIGIDVDAYGAKRGADTLALAEEAWGPLPPTWVSTSKRDGMSGIRLYRIPEGLAWPGELPQGKGVELIRWDHRYMIVAPSIHDLTSEEYRWCKEVLQEVPGSPDAEVAITLVDEEESFPDADGADIPSLPEEWVTGLTSGKQWEETPETEMSASEIQAWLLARPGAEAPCAHTRSLISKGLLAIQKAGDDGGAHDAARDAAWGLLNDAKAGHPGVAKALRALKGAFLENVKGRRDTERQARTEWSRIIQKGIRKVDGDKSNPYEENDPCETIAPLGSAGSGRVGSGDVYPLDGLGDTARFVRVFAGNVRWVPAWSAWAIWRDTAWEADNDQAERWGWKAFDEMEEEAKHVANYEDGESMVKRYMAHRKSHLDQGKVRSVLEALKSRKGMRVEAAAFDANPSHLAVANGVLELTKGGVRLLSPIPDMYITKNTRVPWVEGAARSSGRWNEFLDRFIPDPELRDWVQRITGYSLLGHNRSRHIVALVGETSTGKSTFAEVIRRVLGDYGRVMTASVLRDNPDDRARPDLLSVFGSRIMVADEVGGTKRLHADQIKRITGAVPISARGMRSNEYISLEASFTPWIVGNSIPTIEDSDSGVERRLLPVPFDHQIARAEEDLDFTEELLAEGAPAILAWAVEGYEKWLGEPRIGDLPIGAIALSQEFREGSHHFGAFGAAMLDRDEEATSVPMHAYQAYQGWCAENGIQQREVMNSRDFGLRMSSAYGKTVSKRVDGKVVKVYKGVKIMSI
jgi:putative DNA primase/helicase